MKASVKRPDEEAKVWTSKDVMGRDPEMLEVPIRNLEDPAEGIVLGFRQEMVTLDPNDEEDVSGSVCSGAGCGTDFIILQFTHGDIDREAVIRGSEVLKAWVRGFDPEAAERIPGR